MQHLTALAFISESPTVVKTHILYPTEIRLYHSWLVLHCSQVLVILLEIFTLLRDYLTDNASLMH